MTPTEQLAQWRAVTDAATEGPWEAPDGAWLYDVLMAEQGGENEQANTEFAAEARTAMPALLAFAEAVLALGDDDENHRRCAIWDPYPTGTEPECDCLIATIRRLAKTCLVFTESVDTARTGAYAKITNSKAADYATNARVRALVPATALIWTGTWTPAAEVTA